MWKGTGAFLLQKFISQHQNAYTIIQQCSAQVPFQLQLLNELIRVKYLLDAIETADPELQASMVMGCQDTGEEGMMNSFESCLAYLLLSDPVAKKRMPAKRNFTEVPSTMMTGSKKQIKSGQGSTGVELRYQSNEEYSKLTKKQKTELHSWHKTKAKAKAPNEAVISAAVVKHIKETDMLGAAAKAKSTKIKEYFLR